MSWVEVDSTAIEHNTRLMRRHVGLDVGVIGVVKADGYGHGAVLAAKAMVAGGAIGLAAATTGEGRRLREAGVDSPILVLGYTAPEQVAEALQHDLALTISAPETLHAAAALGQAAGRALKLHLKIDTGMHRLGLLPHEVMPFLEANRAIGGVIWQGIFTHLAVADEPWRPETARQLTCFEDILAAMRLAGYHFPFVHAANSAGALYHPHARYDAVRAGIALYGAACHDEARLPSGFRPALSFHTRIVRVATLPVGSSVSYGAEYITPGPRRIATIAAGYADGIRRSPAWREALIHGERAPIVGRICMDYAMVDVTHIPEAETGATVTLLGAQGEAVITVEEVAAWLGTSAYEALTTIAPRGRGVGA
jgi:alanine racemase